MARGPLNIASFLLGTTELMMAMMIEPEKCHKMIGMISDFLIDWIGYQIEKFPTIEGILLLDERLVMSQILGAVLVIRGAAQLLGPQLRSRS